MPTAERTVVRLAVPGTEAGAPWPMPRVLDAVARLGAQRVDRPRAVGRGRGAPVLASADLLWYGLPAVVETVAAGPGAAEVALELPPLEEVSDAADEASWWALVDAVADAAAARHGAIGDGEPLDLRLPQAGEVAGRLRAHLGLLVPAWLAAGAGAAAAMLVTLERSGLVVLVR